MACWDDVQDDDPVDRALRDLPMNSWATAFRMTLSTLHRPLNGQAELTQKYLGELKNCQRRYAGQVAFETAFHIT
jgi:hypothetical protein